MQNTSERESFYEKVFYKHNTVKIQQTKKYKVNFDKVKTIEDIKLILESIHIGFNINFIESYDKFDELKKLLIEVE